MTRRMELGRGEDKAGAEEDLPAILEEIVTDLEGLAETRVELATLDDRRTEEL